MATGKSRISINLLIGRHNLPYRLLTGRVSYGLGKTHLEHSFIVAVARFKISANLIFNEYS
jgi:hypothetical protein